MINKKLVININKSHLLTHKKLYLFQNRVPLSFIVFPTDSMLIRSPYLSPLKGFTANAIPRRLLSSSALPKSCRCIHEFKLISGTCFALKSRGCHSERWGWLDQRVFVDGWRRFLAIIQPRWRGITGEGCIKLARNGTVLMWIKGMDDLVYLLNDKQRMRRASNDSHSPGQGE